MLVILRRQEYKVRDATVADFTEDDFPTTGNWVENGLDLSSIVPPRAIAVDFIVRVAGDAANHDFILTRNHQTYVKNGIQAITQAVDVHNEVQGRIAIDADRLLDYWRSPNINYIRVTITGWILGR